MVVIQLTTVYNNNPSYVTWLFPGILKIAGAYDWWKRLERSMHLKQIVNTYEWQLKKGAEETKRCGCGKDHTEQFMPVWVANCTWMGTLIGYYRHNDQPEQAKQLRIHAEKLILVINEWWTTAQIQF